MTQVLTSPVKVITVHTAVQQCDNSNFSLSFCIITFLQTTWSSDPSTDLHAINVYLCKHVPFAVTIKIFKNKAPTDPKTHFSNFFDVQNIGPQMPKVKFSFITDP